MEKIAIIKLGAQSIKLSLFDVASNGYYNLFDNAPGADDFLQSFRKRTVGIQLNGISHAFDLFKQLCSSRVQQRLPTCDCDAVKKFFTAFQKGEKFTGTQLHIFLAPPDQGSIVAEGTAEIASAGKYGASDLAGKIQQCHLP